MNPAKQDKPQANTPAPETAPFSEDTPDRKDIYLIDGSGFIFRAFHALPPLTRADGTPVGAVLGFCNIVLKLLDSHDIDNMAVVFDSARSNFRHDIYDQYKANRGETPEDLIPQFPLFRDVCTAFQLAQIELDGYEADDIIATYTNRAVEKGHNVTIVSSDKDLMQLVGPQVRMLDPIKNKFIGPDEVFEKFGVAPEKVTDIQALAGDSTDNIPGVPGIGVKTAALLINEFGDLDALLENAHTIKQKKRRENLMEFAGDARMSRKLVSLATDAPVELRLADLALKNPDTTKLHHFLLEQGFTNLINRLIQRGMLHPIDHSDSAEGKAPSGFYERIPKSNQNDNDKRNAIIKTLQSAKTTYHLVTKKEELDALIEKCYQAGTFAFDTETTDLNPSRADLVSISLCPAPGNSYYIPLLHKNHEDQLDFNLVLSHLRPLLSSSSVKVVGQNLKYDMRILLNYGIEIASYEDTMVMSYCAHGTKHKHNFDDLCKLIFSHETIHFKDLMDHLKKEEKLKSPNFSDVPVEKAYEYACEDADYTLRLYHVLKQDLVDHQAHNLYYNIDLPMVKVLALMEHKGVMVCRDNLQGLSQKFEQELETLSKQIYEKAGRDFNIGSPKQLGEVLFDDLGISTTKKGKAGSFSTGADILEKLAEQGHDIAEYVLSWRHYAKLKSTYADALQKEISPDTNRVHTSYGLTGTSTGRLSSSDPNLQNIPIRTEEGREIRKAFVSQKGYKLLALDYSQIELRLLAHVAEMDSLKKAFQNHVDIHALTASEIFEIPLDKIDSLTRRSAKAINFGIIYGISPFGLARQLNISRTEAKDHIDRYFEKYPGIRKYMEKQKQFARDNGYVETLLGRRCTIKGINDTNPIRRAAAERQAINAPLQGASADIIKKAMITITDVLNEYADDANQSWQTLSKSIKTPQQSRLSEESKYGHKKTQLDFFTESLPQGVSRGVTDLLENNESAKNRKALAELTAGEKSAASHPLSEQKPAAVPIIGPYGVVQSNLIGDKVRLLLQVHDELIFEVREDLVDEIAPKLKRHMESVVHLDVPLVVDCGIGDTWDEAH